MEVFLRLILLALCVQTIRTVVATGESVVIEDGAGLARMGNLFDNPLLRMLGKVFMNTEGLVQKSKDEIFDDLCDLHPCTAWSDWSGCSAVKAGSYGMQSRSRKCGIDSPFCIQPRPVGEQSTPVDSRICEGYCNINYTLTEYDGHCLRLYNDATVSKDMADKQCMADGGFVVNINSETKSNSVHEVLLQGGVTSQTIWIDGRRDDIDSPWRFQYETMSNWTNWYSGEPSNSGDQYCRVEESKSRQWYDRNCDGPYWFVCELSPTTVH